MSKYTWDNFLVLLGKDPKKFPQEEWSQQAKEIHDDKWITHKKEFLLKKAGARELHVTRTKWKKRRWAFLIFVNLFFFLSYKLDIQLLEGSLTGSRLFGFHLIDLNAALQIMLAHKQIIVNLVIGTATILLFWAIFGGRSFCSWVCPYHLVSELAEKLHLYLVKKKLAVDIKFSRKTRTVLYVSFLLLSFITGYTYFETISATGILSRALIYGPSSALIILAVIILFEIFVSRRAWCRYVCPIGLTYGLVGNVSPVRVKYRMKNCFHEGDCRKVCLVPHALEIVLKGRAADSEIAIGPDCTRCGMCVDVCPSGALQFDVKGMDKVL